MRFISQCANCGKELADPQGLSVSELNDILIVVTADGENARMFCGAGCLGGTMIWLRPARFNSVVRGIHEWEPE